jgi:hypothetical protein
LKQVESGRQLISSSKGVSEDPICFFVQDISSVSETVRTDQLQALDFKDLVPFLVKDIPSLKDPNHQNPLKS